MSWKINMVKIVRGLIGDLTIPHTYSDTRIEELICTAAVMTIQEIDFIRSYTINLNAYSITPDPSSLDDIDFESLISLRTACLISSGEFNDASRRAISVKTGQGFVDNKAKATYLKDMVSYFCGSYLQSKANYQMGDGSLGRTIVGPYNKNRELPEIIKEPDMTTLDLLQALPALPEGTMPQHMYGQFSQDLDSSHQDHIFEIARILKVVG